MQEYQGALTAGVLECMRLWECECECERCPLPELVLEKNNCSPPTVGVAFKASGHSEITALLNIARAPQKPEPHTHTSCLCSFPILWGIHGSPAQGAASGRGGPSGNVISGDMEIRKIRACMKECPLRLLS